MTFLDDLNLAVDRWLQATRPRQKQLAERDIARSTIAAAAQVRRRFAASLLEEDAVSLALQATWEALPTFDPGRASAATFLVWRWRGEWSNALRARSTRVELVPVGFDIDLLAGPAAGDGDGDAETVAAVDDAAFEQAVDRWYPKFGGSAAPERDLLERAFLRDDLSVYERTVTLPRVLAAMANPTATQLTLVS